MRKVSGLILKKEGVVIVSDGKKSVIKWVDTKSHDRVFFYLVYLQGRKYTKPYRLTLYEAKFWIDTISAFMVKIDRGEPNGRTKNYTRF